MKKRPPSVNFNGIKLSPRFFDAAAQEPEVTIGFDPSVPYLPAYPWLFDTEDPVAPLHDCVWDFFHKDDRPKKEGEIIHHIDGDPLNATIENLGVGSRSAHALAHAVKRQRFTPRKRWRLFGFFRPRAEAPVVTLPPDQDQAYREQLLAREHARQLRDQLRRDWIDASSKARRDVLKRSHGHELPPSSSSAPPGCTSEPTDLVLERMLPQLRAQLDHLYTGKKIPPPAGRPRKKDRLLGIGRLRRGCTPAEAALVRLLVKNSFAVSLVSNETRLPVRVLAKMMTEPAVALAIEHWHHHRRLPPPSSAKKLKPYRRDVA